jgi:hypothetical protein
MNEEQKTFADLKTAIEAVTSAGQDLTLTELENLTAAFHAYEKARGLPEPSAAG